MAIGDAKSGPRRVGGHLVGRPERDARSSVGKSNANASRSVKLDSSSRLSKLAVVLLSQAVLSLLLLPHLRLDLLHL